MSRTHSPTHAVIEHVGARDGARTGMTVLATVIALSVAASTTAPQTTPDRPAVVPFTIHVPDPVLRDIRTRLAQTRFPDAIESVTIGITIFTAGSRVVRVGLFQLDQHVPVAPIGSPAKLGYSFTALAAPLKKISTGPPVVDAKANGDSRARSCRARNRTCPRTVFFASAGACFFCDDRRIVYSRVETEAGRAEQQRR
jgi:hypothetical protein